MRILHLLQSESFSGAESIACHIISLFREENELLFVSQDGPIRQELENRNINFYPLKKVDLTNIKKAVCEFKPDVIHAHDFTASFYASFCNVPVVSHLHSNPEWLSKVTIKSLAYAYALKNISSVLGVSDIIKEEYIFKRLLKDKFIVLPNIVDADSVISKANNEIFPGEIDILYVGRFSREKNPLLFLQIVNELALDNNDIKAVMVGNGDLLEECRCYIKDHNIENNVQLTGFLSNPYPIMKAAKIIVIPSIYEGFGLVAVEGMLLDTVVVCTGVGGLKDIVDESCGCFCSDVDSFVHTIRDLLNNGQRLNELKKNGEEKAKVFCNTIKYKERLSAVYAHLLKDVNNEW